MATVPLMAPSCPLQTHRTFSHQENGNYTSLGSGLHRALQEAQNALHCFQKQNALGFVSITTVGGDTKGIKHLVFQNKLK